MLYSENLMMRSNPRWSRDELILALDLYLKNRVSLPSPGSDAVRNLSVLLNSMAQALGTAAAADFRNANGVSMKLMNFQRLDPMAKAAGKKGLSHGGKAEELIWNEFSSNPAHVSQVARAIRDALEDEGTQISQIEDAGIEEALEGRVLTRLHKTRERNRRLVAQRKEIAMRDRGRLVCEVCGFDFALVFGARGEGFIEVHHTKPIHLLHAGEKTRLADLALVCSNCHRMIHARKGWLTIEQLREIIRAPQE